MEVQHFSHQHPLVLTEEPSHESEKVYCAGCGELVSGPSFRCVDCGFYLDKQCAEAPSELNHPFHRDHNLELLVSPIYPGSDGLCGLCGKSCNSPFQELKAKCFACWKPLSDSVYLSLDSGFRLHKKCVDLPAEINHFCHTQHPLVLQFNSKDVPCQICKSTQGRGFGLVYFCSSCEIGLHVASVDLATKINHLCHRKHPLILQTVNKSLACQICQETKEDGSVYYCSICKFALHIECASPSPPVIEHKSHQHTFVLFWRHVSFVCDACGTPGKFESYICSTCGIILHKKCISLPLTLRQPKHYEGPISHTYFLGQYEIESWECRICHLEDVNSEHGGYYCSDCNYVAHVNCAIQDYNWYEFDKPEINDENLEDDSALLPPYSIIKESKDGENVVATEIKHFSHDHNLVLSNDMSDDKYCDGCVLSIFTCYYGCSECGFFLHKSCAELPRKMHLWFHSHPKLHPHTVDRIFRCESCDYESSGFAYTCNLCYMHYCLRCALVSDNPICEGHEHRLPCYKYKALCNACGVSSDWPFRCKGCNFALHCDCLTLPLTARHKSDEHPYKLTYHDNKNYPASNYCDICEEERNPNLWFYHCAICDNSAHPICVLGKYSFTKLGRICRLGDHPHPLTFVQKVHYYPECLICGKPCLDISLECKKIGCSYIVHWECIKPHPFGTTTTIRLLSKDEANEAD
ncbi:hypothetical protein PTKIN_Ptkin16aG0491200 [Pterospermum kingtungense]